MEPEVKKFPIAFKISFVLTVVTILLCIIFFVLRMSIPVDYYDINGGNKLLDYFGLVFYLSFPIDFISYLFSAAYSIKYRKWGMLLVFLVPIFFGFMFLYLMAFGNFH